MAREAPKCARGRPRANLLVYLVENENHRTCPQGGGAAGPVAFEGLSPGAQGGGERTWWRSEATWLHFQDARPIVACHRIMLHCSINLRKAALKASRTHSNA